MINSGELVPSFSLPDQNGLVHSIDDYRGKWVLVYFYPKDDTPACTTEACNFRDSYAELVKLGVEVIGISTDSVKKHKKFEQKYDLPFTLLADEQKEVVQKFGVWGEKKFMGRLFIGTHRVSFLIDPEGKVAKVYDKVEVKKHVQDVITDLKTLKTNPT